jgi:toxin ParE1/3/4
VEFSESALDDLESIKEYYQDLGVPSVGVEFVIAIFMHVETLIDHPEIGRIVPEYSKAHIREIMHPPFRIVYLRAVDVIHIVRVWRSERLLRLSNPIEL